MITIHQDIADLAEITADQQRQAAFGALESHIERLSRQVPHMLAEGGPGFVVHEGVITLPEGQFLRFRGSLEIVE